MENALLISLSRQIAMTRQMSVIANNLANMNTNGFKSEGVLFEEYVMPGAQEQSPDKTLSFVLDYGLSRNMADGRLETTGSPFDLAISGPGHFKIETEAGIRYTRNGHFQLDNLGRLVTSSGGLVLTESGAPITFDETDGDIEIASDGTISTELGQRGKIAVVQFDNDRLMQKEGSDMLSTEQDELPVAKPNIAQGALESSNVQAIVEMTNMVEVLRSYTSAAKMVERTDELKRRAISTLGRPPT